jgi:hypothetical protein
VSIVVAIMITIVVVVAVVVPPVPVLPLFVMMQLAKLAMWIAMGFNGPLVVVDDLTVIPAMIVVVVGIVEAVVMVLGTSDRHQRRSQSDSQ